MIFLKEEKDMCVPISVLTKGRISGCTGLCTMWLHIGTLVVLCAGLVWNFVRGRSTQKDKGKD
jgi:hypothetical protein